MGFRVRKLDVKRVRAEAEKDRVALSKYVEPRDIELEDWPVLYKYQSSPVFGGVASIDFTGGGQKIQASLTSFGRKLLGLAD